MAALLIAAPSAFAQEASSVSIGLACSFTMPTNPAAGNDAGPSVLLRLRGDRGFGPSLALNWFTTPLRTEVGGQQVELGKLSVRPLLFGVGYGHHLSRRLKWNVSAAAGIAFAHARATGTLKEAFERLGLGQVGVRVPDSFAWRVGTGLWIDLSARFGMVVSVGYLAVQPEITVTTSTGDRRHPVDLDSIVTSVGFTYGIF
jgi:hypothetical protein